MLKTASFYDLWNRRYGPMREVTYARKAVNCIIVIGAAN